MGVRNFVGGVQYVIQPLNRWKPQYLEEGVKKAGP